MIILLAMMFLYFRLFIYEVIPHDVLLLEFVDVRTDVTYLVYYNQGSALDWQIIKVIKKNGYFDKKRIGVFERYDTVLGFELLKKDTLKIILGDSRLNYYNIDTLLISN